MTKDRWEKLKDKIETQFGPIELTTESLGDESGGHKEIVEFSGPLGKIKLEFTEKPRLVREKTSYSKRIGAQVQVEKEYDPDETVTYMKPYKWVAGDWEAINAELFE